jgi:hypothetical protein
MASPKRAGAPEDEITDEMISAGLAEMDDFDLMEVRESQRRAIELISRVYRAMHRSRLQE